MDTAFYSEQGYVIERALLSADECTAIYDAGMAMIAGADTPNRIMNPHHDSDLFLRYLCDSRVVDAIERLAEDEVVGNQTMFYIKPAGSTGHGWHQDNYYITGRPKPCLAAWCALGPVNGENGGLIVFPGSHRTRELFPMVPHDNPAFGNHARIVEPPATCEPLLVELDRGDVLYFDGCLIHGSYPNVTVSDDRPAFISHYVPKPSLLATTAGDRVAVRSPGHRDPAHA